MFLQLLKKLPLENPDDSIFINLSIVKIVKEFCSFEYRYLLIDEIHKYPNWSQENKNFYDFFSDLIIRFTGSSMLNIINEQYDLSRKVAIIKMQLLSFREYSDYKK